MPCRRCVAPCRFERITLHPDPLGGKQGPIIKLKYEANMKKSIGMVAGGTGITPMLQARLAPSAPAPTAAPAPCCKAARGPPRPRRPRGPQAAPRLALQSRLRVM